MGQVIVKPLDFVNPPAGPVQIDGGSIPVRGRGCDARQVVDGVQ
jgi:hypothetical protein